MKDVVLMLQMWLRRRDGSLGMPTLQALIGNIGNTIGLQEALNISGRTTVHLRILVNNLRAVGLLG